MERWSLILEAGRPRSLAPTPWRNLQRVPYVHRPIFQWLHILEGRLPFECNGLEGVGLEGAGLEGGRLEGGGLEDGGLEGVGSEGGGCDPAFTQRAPRTLIVLD